MSSDPSGYSSRPGLDADQAIAVAADGSVVVLGGPGSGKTTLLVERAAWLIDSGVPKEQILLLALSRRIADDLTSRLAARLGAATPAVATTHALALSLVRRHYREAGYSRSPRRLQAQDAWQRLRQALEAEDPRRWPRYGSALHTRTLLAQVSDLVAGAAANVLDRAGMEAALERQGRGDLVELARFASDYRLQMKRDGLLDMEQAVAEAALLLERHPELRLNHRKRYPHLMVDEFEEATFAQARLVQLLGGEGLFVAGNPNQSTNSFRGGSPTYLMEMAHEAPGSGVTLLRLEGNQRCSPGVQEACRRLMDGVSSGSSLLEPIPAEEVSVHPFPYQAEEAQWLAGEIAGLLRGGTAPHKIAVLFRSGADPVARGLARQLERLGVPFQPLGEPETVGTDPMVGSAVEVIRFLLAPPESDRDRLFLGLLASPICGVTPAELRALRRAAQSSGRDALELAQDPAVLSELPETSASAIADLASRLRSLAPAIELPPSELIWKIWATLPAFARQAVAWGERRLEECPGSPSAFRTFQAEVGRLMEEKPLLSAAHLLALWDGGHFREIPTSGEAPGRGGVALTTIHRARGQGWPYLFIPDLVEGVYPLRRSPIGTLSPLLLRGDGADDASPQQHHLAEERRLLYVAISRAGRRVYLSHSSTGMDGTSRLTPSRFLSALAARLPSQETATLAVDLPETVAHYRRQLKDADSMAVAEALYALGKLSEAFPDRVDPSNWWDNLEESVGAAPPYPDGKLYLSASRLAAYRDCPQRYKFAQHLRLEEVTGDAMTLGSLFHAVLEEYHRPDADHPHTREVMERIVERQYDPAAFSRPAVARQVRRRMNALLNDYFPRYGQSDGVMRVETPFRFQLGPHTISGRIDRIDRLGDGTLELIDYKTGSAMSMDDARTDIQLALYELAFQHAPELGELGRPSLATYLYPKAIGKRATTNGKRSYTPSEEGRERLLEKIARYSRGILEERFPPHSGILDCWPGLDPEEVAQVQKGDPCRFCSFDWVCPEMERGPANG